jgi:hypothetical protein
LSIIAENRGEIKFNSAALLLREIATILCSNSVHCPRFYIADFDGTKRRFRFSGTESSRTLGEESWSSLLTPKMIEALDDGRVESFEENAEHQMNEETSRITGNYSPQSSQQSVRRDDINGIRESILFIEVVNVCCPQRSG